MNLNEHTSKLLFKEAEVTTTEGVLLHPGDIQEPEFPAPWIIKAQVLTGGRGKAGGVRKAETSEEFHTACRDILGMQIKGHDVPFVRVEPVLPFEREFYLSFAVARSRESIVLTAGPGGMEVESMPEKLLIQKIPPQATLDPHVVRAAFFHLGGEEQLGKAAFPGFQELLEKLYAAVRRYGLLLAEINPLVLSKDGVWTALDGKVDIDDNVVDITPDLARFYEPAHAAPEENKARDAGLSYVELNGWVGLLVNGAGLAMATMDLLNLSGLPAANFMDLGGAANQERMRTALELLFSHTKVKAVFLNLFGGIVSCEDVAKALLTALDGAPPSKPLVLRLSGNGSDAARELLETAALPDVHLAPTANDALKILRDLSPDKTPAPETSHPPDIRITTVEVPAPSAPAAPCMGLNKESRLLIQGATGKAARHHAGLMQEYGTTIAAGVTPFKGGEQVLGAPVYDSVNQACREQGGFDASIIFVPAPFAADAILEAVENEIPYAICITEGIPQAHMLRVRAALKGSKTNLVGPNTPGVIVPGQTKMGIMPAMAFTPGPVAVFSRSGTLTYESASLLSDAGIGQSVCVGVGGDPFVGMNFIELYEAVRHCPQTKAVLVLGEIGGNAEESLAAHLNETGMSKPVFSFIAGRTAPPGKRLGHAGAILEEGGGGIEGKLDAMRNAGFVLCDNVAELPVKVAKGLGK